MSTYIESLLSKKVLVPAQTDTEYKFTSNQCSWCAAEFAVNRKALAKAFFEDEELFVSLYKKCLKEGSNKRLQCNHRTYGENIDNQILLDKCNPKLSIIKYCTYTKGESSIVSLLPEDLAKEFYTNKYVDGFSLSDMSMHLSYIMVSRHGQSLTVIPLGSGDFLVLDSHVHTVGLMNRASAEQYIKCDIADGYNHCTLIYGN